MNYTVIELSPYTGELVFLIMSFLPCLVLLPIWVYTKARSKPVAVAEAKVCREPPYQRRYPLVTPSQGGKRPPRPNHMLLEKTPRGFIIMRYSQEEEGFEYWADRGINYKYLETVARKYVNVFSCPQIYINRYELLQKKLAKLQDKLDKRRQGGTDTGSHQEQEPDSVFAKFKRSKDNIAKRTKLIRSDIVCDTANKFIHMGKLRDTESRNLAQSKEQSGVSEPLGWDSWKQAMATLIGPPVDIENRLIRRTSTTAEE